MSTVSSLDTVRDIMDEMGKEQIDSVYSFTTMDKKRKFAVFYTGQVIDIYTSPYCKDPKCVFRKGRWLI